MERVLVCLLASTRAHKLTFPSFKRRLLDELNGDLALAILIDEKYEYTNPFWQHAKYRWTAPIFRDYGKAFDLAQSWLCQQHKIPAADWRIMLQIKGIWQGGIQSLDPQPSSSSVLLFCRWLLLNGLQQDQLLDRYDRFVITRPDFVWLCPHPPLSILDRDAIWLPEGEDYGGLNDRHLVVSRTDVENCLNLIEGILLNPTQLYEEMKNQPGYNDERIFAHHLKGKELVHKVKRFPYVMYSAREMDDESPTWSYGRYEPTVRHYVKYEHEYRTAVAYATILRCRADWEKGAWMQFDPTSVASCPTSLLRRSGYACEALYFKTYFKIRSALRRPGRVMRFWRFCQRALRSLNCAAVVKFFR
jgi:hypothetical protein